MESFLFERKSFFVLILFIFFFQTVVQRRLIYLNDEYEFVVELHAGFAAKWRRTDSQTDPDWQLDR